MNPWRDLAVCFGGAGLIYVVTALAIWGQLTPPWW